MVQPPPKDDDARASWLVLLLREHHCTHRRAADLVGVTESTIARWVAARGSENQITPKMAACELLLIKLQGAKPAGCEQGISRE